MHVGDKVDVLSNRLFPKGSLHMRAIENTQVR